MAKQISPVVKLRGTIDDLNFYKSQDGILAREKGGVDGQRIKTDPRFRLTRLNGQEFSTGAKAGQFFRSVWDDELSIASDNRVISRLVKDMMTVLQTDTSNSYGARQVAAGNLLSLKGFEFNRDLPLNVALKVMSTVTVTIDRATGQLTASLPSFVPQKKVAAPGGTTHYRIFTAAAAIDFVGETVVVARQSTANLPWDNTLTAVINLQQSVTANSPHPLFLVLGIEFMKIVDGEVFTQSKGLNALQLVKVDMP